MTISKSDSNNAETLRIVDPELPFLASQAAIEIDNLILGRNPKLNYVYILGTKLRNSFDIDTSNDPPNLLIDPPTLTIVGEAINESHNHTRVNKVDELVEKAKALASDLTEETQKKDNFEKLEWVRAFCVALSRLSAAYHGSILDLRQTHPFRR